MAAGDDNSNSSISVAGAGDTIDKTDVTVGSEGSSGVRQRRLHHTTIVGESKRNLCYNNGARAMQPSSRSSKMVYMSD